MGQQTPVVGAHEQRAIRPVANEVSLVPAALDHDVRDAEGKGSVRSRPHLQPNVGFLGRTGATRVNHNQARAALHRLNSGSCVEQPGQVGIVAPKEDAAGVLQVGHECTGNGGAEGVLRRQISPPAAQFHRYAQIRAAVGVHQALNPDDRVVGGRSGRGDDTEDDALGTMRLGNFAQPGGRQIERFIPADPLPSRVGIALGPRTFHRIAQPVRMVDEFRRRPSLGTERLAGWVRRIRLEGDKTAVLHHGDRTTTRHTQGAVTRDALARMRMF